MIDRVAASRYRGLALGSLAVRSRSIIHGYRGLIFLLTAHNTTPPICHPQWSTSDSRQYTLLQVSFNVSGWLLTGLSNPKYINMDLPSKHVEYTCSFNNVISRSSVNPQREAAAVFHYARTLPVDAASCAIRRANIRHAVELVEQGRG